MRVMMYCYLKFYRMSLTLTTCAQLPKRNGNLYTVTIIRCMNDMRGNRATFKLHPDGVLTPLSAFCSKD